MLNFLRSMMGGSDEAVVDAIRNGAVIIDVRTPAEFRGGHVAGSKNIPLNELQANMSALPKGTPIVFCCASGARSGSATSLAASKGYTAHNGGPWTSVNRMVAEVQGA
jgi:rhodanese-related sulfurtransferase